MHVHWSPQMMASLSLENDDVVVVVVETSWDAARPFLTFLPASPSRRSLRALLAAQTE